MASGCIGFVAPSSGVQQYELGLLH